MEIKDTAINTALMTAIILFFTGSANLFNANFTQSIICFGLGIFGTVVYHLIP